MKIDKQYLDSQLDTAQRVDILLQQMTLEEKLGQMLQLAALEEDHESFIERYHIGSYLHALGEDVTRLQQLNRQQSRLNIPLIFGIDAIHGHCFEDHNTVFPVQLALACTWHSDLLTHIGQVTAKEARASHLHWTFSPVLCMARDLRWGRCGETFGEDTLLVTTLAAALCRGYQSADYPLAACAKHYAAYGEAVGGRDSADCDVSERRLRSVLLPPFEHLAHNGCMTFMTAYQSLNGIPCAANTWLMNEVLRDEWGYEGVVVTDWNNCGQMLSLQNAAPDMKQAVYQCLLASNDIFMSTPEFFEHALALVREGSIPQARIDTSVRRILRLKFELGLFDQHSAPDRAEVLADPRRWQLCLQAARQSLTLVKNSGVLPFNLSPKTILLVGDNADCLRNQLGDWSFVPGMAAYEDSDTHRADTVTLFKALDKLCSESDIQLEFAGADCVGPECTLSQFDDLQRRAANADIIVFCAGDALKQYGEFHDRADLNLSGNQNAAFEALVQTGTPIVSVLLASKPHCIEPVLAHSQALLIAFNPGAMGGTAIVECLFGAINPSGRLPISFPRHVGQLPVYYNQAPGWHASLSLHYDKDDHYIDLAKGALLAFGEGMSYSEIRYAEARLTKPHIATTGSLELHIAVTNHSARSATEVVQVYKQLCVPGVSTVEKQLHMFRRVQLAAGQQLELVFVLQASDFVVLDKALKQTAYCGKVILMVGKSSKAEDLQDLEFYIE
ncbi:MAG: glycoside hydrolase family 3 C-terminal domain-containing protein [Cellvibrionaceae bacterium]|nr:glycoside hydrolase family 3 C-terminal domain-containing protein [Cellvibrionaceae bacterium]